MHPGDQRRAPALSCLRRGYVRTASAQAFAAVAAAAHRTSWSCPGRTSPSSGAGRRALLNDSLRDAPEDSRDRVYMQAAVWGAANGSAWVTSRGPGYVLPMAVRRIVAYAGGDELAASREFYVEVLGMRVVMEDPVLDLQSPDDPAAEVIIGAQEMHDPQPSFGVDVGEPAAVDAAHAEAVRRGLRVVYPLTDEPWGVRRFFVEDPGGTIVNVLAHIT